jgi:sRNA-binding protein
MCPFDDEHEFGRLKPAAVALWHQHQKTAGELEKTASELEQARARIAELEAQLRAKKAGKAAKRRTRAAPTPSEPTTPSAPARAERTGHGPRSQPGIETRERVWDLDEADRV